MSKSKVHFESYMIIFLKKQRRREMNKEKKYSSPYEFEGRLPLKQAIPMGLQHVLAMFVGNFPYISKSQ